MYLHEGKGTMIILNYKYDLCHITLLSFVFASALLDEGKHLPLELSD